MNSFEYSLATILTIALSLTQSLEAFPNETPSNSDEHLGQLHSLDFDDFPRILARTKQLAKIYREQLSLTEKRQPTWDSRLLKIQLSNLLSGLESENTINAEPYRKLHMLTCESPLLDFDLVKSEMALWDESEPLFSSQHIFWRSGNDWTVLLPSIPKRCKVLGQDLDKVPATETTAPLQQMKTLFAKLKLDINKGDTDKADDVGFEMLKLAEQSGNENVYLSILNFYRCFNRAMIYRPNHARYKSRLIYVEQELRFFETDRSLYEALDRSQIDLSVKKELKEMYAELTRLRRSGDTIKQKYLYEQFINLANHSDTTGEISNSALNLYVQYLLSESSTRENLNELKSQVLAPWLKEESDRQPEVAERNKTMGGDWGKLEKALQNLEAQSYVVYRDINVSDKSDESRPEELFTYARTKNPMSAGKGMIYYRQNPVDTYLLLHCVYKEHIESTADDLLKSLLDAGFTDEKATHYGNDVLIVASWRIKKLEAFPPH